MKKILIACALDWVASEIAKDLKQDENNDVTLLTSMKKKYFLDNHPSLINSINISYTSMFLRKLVQYIKINNRLFMQLFYLYFDLITAFFIIRKRPEIFVGYTSMSLLSLYICKFFNIKTFLYNGNTHMANDMFILSKITDIRYSSLTNKFIIFIARQQYKTVDKIIIESSNAKNAFIENGIPENKLLIMLTKIDHNIFKLEEKKEKYLSKNKYRFISVGLSRRKGILTLMSIWEDDAFRQRKDIELILVGSIEDAIIDDVHKFIENTNNVVYHQSLDSYSLANEYKKSNVFILLTYQDGGPRALVEAYHCGCIILSTPNCIAKDLIVNNEEILISEPDDYKKIKKDMLFLIENNIVTSHSKIKDHSMNFRKVIK